MNLFITIMQRSLNFLMDIFLFIRYCSKTPIHQKLPWNQTLSGEKFPPIGNSWLILVQKIFWKKNSQLLATGPSLLKTKVHSYILCTQMMHFTLPSHLTRPACQPGQAPGQAQTCKSGDKGLFCQPCSHRYKYPSFSDNIEAPLPAADPPSCWWNRPGTCPEPEDTKSLDPFTRPPNCHWTWPTHTLTHRYVILHWTLNTILTNASVLCYSLIWRGFQFEALNVNN